MLTRKGVEAVSQLLYGSCTEWDGAELLLSLEKEETRGYPQAMFSAAAEGRSFGAEDTGPPGLFR